MPPPAQGSVQFTDIYPDGPAAAAAAGVSGDALGGPLGNADYPGLPPGAVPKHRDKLITTATTTDIWIPAAGRIFVVTRIFLTSDVAQVVTLYDQDNVEGQRLLRIPLTANGGTDPNGYPVSYESKLAGNTLRALNTVAGNLFIAVDGYERDA